jgi:hypothetical protein
MGCGPDFFVSPLFLPAIVFIVHRGWKRYYYFKSRRIWWRRNIRRLPCRYWSFCSKSRSFYFALCSLFLSGTQCAHNLLGIYLWQQGYPAGKFKKSRYSRKGQLQIFNASNYCTKQQHFISQLQQLMELHKSKPSKDDFWRGFSYTKCKLLNVQIQYPWLTSSIQPWDTSVIILEESGRTRKPGRLEA